MVYKEVALKVVNSDGVSHHIFSNVKVGGCLANGANIVIYRGIDSRKFLLSVPFDEVETLTRIK